MNAPQAWEQHFRERERVWCSYDALAAAVSVCALVIAALRVDGGLALCETLMHTALVGLAVALMVRRSMDGYSTWRNLAVVLLRLGFSSSTIIRRHALRVLSDQPRDVSSLAALLYFPAALLRVMVGDHTALLAFLGFAWPVGTVSNALVQAACVALMCRQNGMLCATPFLRGASAAIRDPGGRGYFALAMHKAQAHAGVPLLRLAARTTEAQICHAYILAMQVALGFVTPVVYWICCDARAAVRYAETHQIDPDDRLYQLHRFLCRWCPGQTAVHFLVATCGLIVALASMSLVVLGGNE